MYRQRNTEDMQDFTDLGAGKVEEAVRSLHARDRIYVLDEYRHRAAAIVDLYLQERRRGRGAGDIGIVADGSNHVLDDLNRRIQRERIVMEEIAPRGIDVRTTDEERSWSLHRGDLVVFRERVVTAAGEVIRDGEQGRIVSPGRHATRHSASTAITRAIEDLHVVIDRETFGQDPIDGLIRDWSRTTEKRIGWSQLDDAAQERWARWKAGEEAPADDRPERTAGQHPAGLDVDPDADTIPMPSVASRGRHAAPETRDDDARERRDLVPVGRHRKPWGHDDIAARARRGAEAVDALGCGDLEVVREAIRDLRDAEADDADVAANRAASESLIQDVDVGPPWPRAPFTSIDERLERRRDAPPRGRHHRKPDRGDASPVVSPQPTPATPPDHEWFDLDGFLAHGTADTEKRGVATPRDVGASRHAGEHTRFDRDGWLRHRMQEPDPQIPPPDHERERW